MRGKPPNRGRSPARSWSRGLFPALCLALAAGCSTPRSYLEADHLYFQDRPRDLLASYADSERDADANALVGLDKMLSAALLAGDWGEAERLAELASARVNIFLAGERGERDALSFLGREKSKPFKGEPHERAMVDFYLGLLRYRRGEYEGALNGFLSAMAKDRGVYRLPVEPGRARQGAENAETVIYSPDYATFAFLAASCCRHIDEPEEAARYLAEAKRIRPELAALFDRGMDPSQNVIAVIEAGRAPEKHRFGQRGETLGYRRAPGPEPRAVLLGGGPLEFGLTDDLYVQATTLGGRAVDELNRLKASRQDALHAAGLATAAAGGMLAVLSDTRRRGGRELQAAGLIGVGVGVAAMVFAETAVDPSADVRSWSTLPDRIYLAIGRSPPGETEVEIQAGGPYGGDQSQRWTGVRVAADRTTLLWFRLLPSRKGGVYPDDVNDAVQAAPKT
jgi:tetratricopeptide (TPR) repeat protein